MPAYSRPDVYVTEELRASLQSTAAQISPTGTFVGVTWKGPDDKPVLCNSFSEYVMVFGGFSTANVASGGLSDLQYAVHQFFLNGGGSCYIQRVTDGAAVGANITIPDRAVGSPDSTLKITAISKGLWGNNIRVQIFDRGLTGSARFDLIVYVGSAVESNIVERFTDLSMGTADSRYAVAVINSLTRGSKFITAEDLDSSTTPPDDIPALGSYTLASGADGGVVDSTDYITGIDRLDAVPHAMVINVPGISDTGTIGALAAFCEGRTDCFAIIDTEVGTNAGDAAAYASTISPATSYAAVYWPHLVVNDPAVSRAGTTKTVAPGGAVVGTIMRVDRSRGPQRTPAGVVATLSGVVALEQDATLDELGTLNLASVNSIRQFPDRGIAIMGGRTLTLSGPSRYITIRRSLIFLKESLRNLLLFSIFEPNDQVLWSTVTSEVSSFLTGYWERQGLRGDTAADAFFVKCDNENNTLTTIEEGELHVEVGVALEYPAEFVILRLGQYENGQISITEA